jgi:hypothetical protein
VRSRFHAPLSLAYTDALKKKSSSSTPNDPDCTVTSLAIMMTFAMCSAVQKRICGLKEICWRWNRGVSCMAEKTKTKTKVRVRGRTIKIYTTRTGDLSSNNQIVRQTSQKT